MLSSRLGTAECKVLEDVVEEARVGERRSQTGTSISVPLQCALDGVQVTDDRRRVSQRNRCKVSRGGGSKELGGPAAPENNRGMGLSRTRVDGRWQMEK